MSHATNFTQNSLSIPSYAIRQQQPYFTERQTAQVDRKIDANNQLLRALEKNQALRTQRNHITCYKHLVMQPRDNRYIRAVISLWVIIIF